MSRNLAERRVWDPPEGWVPIRMPGARFAVPPGYVVERSDGAVHARNRRDEPDRGLLLQVEPSVASPRRHAARVAAMAESYGERVVAESLELLDGAPAVRLVLERADGGTSVAYLTVGHGGAWDLRIVVARSGGVDAVVEFEQIVATFRFDRRSTQGPSTRHGRDHAPDANSVSLSQSTTGASRQSRSRS